MSGNAANLLIWPVPLFKAVLRFLSQKFSYVGRRYRPERHYMRGPGPAWRGKRGLG